MDGGEKFTVMEIEHRKSTSLLQERMSHILSY